MLTPYQFASNTSIQAIDLDGLEAFHFTREKKDDGTTELRYSHQENIKVTVGVGKTIVNPRQEYIVTEYREGPIDINGGLDGFQMVEYPVDITYNSLDDAISDKNGSASQLDILVFRFAQYQAATKIENAANGGGGMGVNLFRKSKFKGLKYDHLKEPKTVGPYLKTTKAQRDRILKYNKSQNGGVIKSEIDGSSLPPQKNK